MRSGEQQFAEPIAYWEKEEGGKKKKKGPATATPVARQQRQQVGQPGMRLSDCGTAYLLVSAKVAAANSGGAAEFMAPVAYFAAVER